jgi:hypothetical protein
MSSTSCNNTCLHANLSPTRKDVCEHLDKLLDEMWVIVEWENHRGHTDDPVTFPTFLVSKLSRQEIFSYMAVFANCHCCSRHTGRDDLPDLPKPSGGVGQYSPTNACICRCRHTLRKLTSAFTMSL